MAKKLITVKFPPDLYFTVMRALVAYEKLLKSEATEETLSMTAIELSDIAQARRVMLGNDRYEGAH